MSATRAVRIAAGRFDEVMPPVKKPARRERAEEEHRIVRRMRDLPPWMVAEIRTLEGIRTAHEVAEEFDIYAWRVRAIWNETLR